MLTRWIPSLTLCDVHREATLSSLPLFTWSRILSACSLQYAIHCPGEAYQCPSHHVQKPRAALRPFRKSFDHSDHRNLDRAGLSTASLFPLTRQSENVYPASRWHALENRAPAAVLAAEKWFSFCSIRSSSSELR